jgi:hypothetical protein
VAEEQEDATEDGEKANGRNKNDVAFEWSLR